MMPTKILFYQLLIFVNLYQHAKNQAFSSFCWRDIVNLKILQYEWPISQILPKYGICARIQQKYSFIIDQIHKKLMTKFSNKFTKPYFWPILPIFRAKNFFSKKSSSVTDKRHELLMSHSQGNFWTKGWKDTQMLIHRGSKKLFRE